jgi:DNA-binding ferritin-like protein
MLADIVRLISLARKITLSVHWHSKCLTVHQHTGDLQGQLYEIKDSLAERAVSKGETIDLSQEKLTHCQKEYKMPSPNEAGVETIIEALKIVSKTLEDLNEKNSATQALIDDSVLKIDKNIFLLNMLLDKDGEKPKKQGLFD